MKSRTGLTANCPVFPAEWGSHGPASLGTPQVAAPVGLRDFFEAARRCAWVTVLSLLAYGITLMWGCM